MQESRPGIVHIDSEAMSKDTHDTADVPASQLGARQGGDRMNDAYITRVRELQRAQGIGSTALHRHTTGGL